MNIENNSNEINNLDIPKVFFRSITFNDGTKIELEHNSIIVFTGANNCGKSQILKDAENFLDATNKLPEIVVRNIEPEFLGNFDNKEFLDKYFNINKQGDLQLIGTARAVSKKDWINFWTQHTLFAQLYKLFLRRISTEFRLIASNPLNRSATLGTSPIYYLNKSENLTQKISDYFHQAFGVDLVLNRNDMETIPLHVGKGPDKKAYTMDRHDEYYAEVSKLPQLKEQGDGMRSFASILLDTFTSEHNITLIDEPEAFLHPPQARILGRMLAQNNPHNRQLFIATHSEDFLQGLIEADVQNVTVVRINRIDNINHISILMNDELKILWSNPLLRYSNILSGLFHEKVILCESDYDCLFYQAIIDAMYEHSNKRQPDILFTHCGGKSRMKDIIKALKALNVPVVAICDFDIINNSNDFKAIADAFGIRWDELQSVGMKKVYDYINAKNSSEENIKNSIKRIGKNFFDTPVYTAYENVETLCREAGLFIVPVGEMECFDKSIDKSKKDWVYHVLEIYNLATESKLVKAREFVQSVIDF